MIQKYLSKLLRQPTRSVPNSLHHACNEMMRHYLKGNKRPRWLAEFPDEHKSLFAEYWLSPGKRLADYRDVDQHFDVLARQCFLDCLLGSFSRLWVCLPDNPEVKSPAQFTYNNEIDAVQFAGDAFHRLHRLSEDFAKKSGADPQLLERTIDFVLPIMHEPGVKRSTALWLLDGAGRQGLVIGQTSPPISFENRQVHSSEGGINCLICRCRKSAEML